MVLSQLPLLSFLSFFCGPPTFPPPTRTKQRICAWRTRSEPADSFFAARRNKRGRPYVPNATASSMANFLHLVCPIETQPVYKGDETKGLRGRYARNTLSAVDSASDRLCKKKVATALLHLCLVVLDRSGYDWYTSEEMNPAAVEIGRLGGKKGGKARAEKLTPERRKEIARKAAKTRWDKKRQEEESS